jgi:hypothetical protein
MNYEPLSRSESIRFWLWITAGAAVWVLMIAIACIGGIR